MMSSQKAVLAVIVMALVTYIPRALPLTIFNRKIKSKWLNSFLYYVPYAVLSAMIFPDILESTGNITTSLIGLGVAILLAYLEKDLIIVALASILAVFIFSF